MHQTFGGGRDLIQGRADATQSHPKPASDERAMVGWGQKHRAARSIPVHLGKGCSQDDATHAVRDEVDGLVIVGKRFEKHPQSTRVIAEPIEGAPIAPTRRRELVPSQIPGQGPHHDRIRADPMDYHHPARLINQVGGLLGKGRICRQGSRFGHCRGRSIVHSPQSQVLLYCRVPRPLARVNSRLGNTLKNDPCHQAEAACKSAASSELFLTAANMKPPYASDANFPRELRTNRSFTVAHIPTDGLLWRSIVVGSKTLTSRSLGCPVLR